MVDENKTPEQQPDPAAGQPNDPTPATGGTAQPGTGPDAAPAPPAENASESFADHAAYMGMPQRTEAPQGDQPAAAQGAPGQGHAAYMPGQSNTDLDQISRKVEQIRDELQKVIVGQDKLIDLLMVALFTGGHALLEGVPGIAKTLTAKSLAKTLSTGFSRIQFTPDLMPADIVGTSVYNIKTAEFKFTEGPVFSNIILIDEVNRSPAKTQAALMEVMEERQVTVDGTTYPMEFPFLVIATQNPVEQEGTYKLPEAQLDRFLFRIKLVYPTLEEERAILERFRKDFKQRKADEINQVFSAEEIRSCQNTVENVYIKDQLLDYIAHIIHDTRNNGDLYLGASPRASLSIMRASKAVAAINGRDFVTPDDIRFVAVPVLNHRIILSPEREMEGIEVEDVIEDIVKKIEVPR